MHKRFSQRSLFQLGILILFVVSVLASSALLLIKPTHAANFSMQTGYYVGTGVAGKIVSGLGFQPEALFIKSSSSSSVGAFKLGTSVMPAANMGFFSAASDNTTTAITLTSDGFTLGTASNVNTVNTVYSWVAFAGSDCTASGTFCIGGYTGTGATSRTITTGFQPSLVLAKRNNGSGMNFRTASMPTGRSEFFLSTAANTAGAYINTFVANGFTVGTTNNTTAAPYYFIAFKNSANIFQEGTYTGDGTDNRSITGVGFKPNAVYVKNSTSATALNRRLAASNDQQLSNASSLPSEAAVDLSDYIQKFESDGFQIGAGVGVNENTIVHYWFAFGGVPTASTASGTYTIASGTYAGNSTARSLTGLGFTPDLVLIKDTTANNAAFRTSLMGSTGTAYVGAPLADQTINAIVSLDADGFSLGTANIVNSSVRIYHWQAFGNAYRPDTKSGAADFAVGVYNPNGVDDTSIPGPPYQLDFVSVKQSTAVSGAFRTSEQPGDLSSFLTGAAEAPNIIQSLTSTGFEVGNNAAANTVGGLYRWFGFKSSSTFAVGSYAGDGVVDKAVTLGGGFEPALVWVKQDAGAQPLQRPLTLTGNSTQYFSTTTNAADRIKTLTATGMTVGNNSEINAAGQTYRYVAWKAPPGVLTGDIVDSTGATVPNPVLTMNPINYPFDCSEASGVLGSTNQKIRINNTTGTATWTSSIAATSGSTALWRNGGNTQQYDYNESSGSPVGCSDGADTDSHPGKLRIEPSSATITPKSGCSTSNINLGSNTNFDESTTNAITLISAASGANINCYWDITGINLRQYIPIHQPSDNYTLNLTITTVAS